MIRCLGPVEVESDGQLWRPSGMLARFVALLAAHRGQTVTVDQFIDELWSGEPIATADSAFRTYTAEVRKRVGESGLDVADRLVRLRSTVAIDIDQFAGLCGRADAAAANREAGTAVLLLKEALDLWRGDAYHGLDFAPGASDKEWLVERRATAEELLAGQLLASGEVSLAVASLRRLVAEAPDRERRSELLMRALADDGRVPEALRAYQFFRRHLKETTGSFPSPVVANLERSLLLLHPEPVRSEELEVGDAESLDDPVLVRLRAAEDDWAAAMDARQTAFDEAAVRGDTSLVAEIALLAEGSGRSFFGEERLGALLRRAIDIVGPDADPQVLARLHAEYVCRIGLETGRDDEQVASSSDWLEAHAHDNAPIITMVTNRALLHLHTTAAAGLGAVGPRIDALLRLSDELGDLDAHADGLAFASRAALVRGDGRQWRALVDEIAQFAIRAGRPIDRWARHAIASTHADLSGDPETWWAHLDAAEAITRVHDVADAALARRCSLLAMRWQDALDARPSLTVPGQDEGERGFAMFTSTLDRSFRGEVNAGDPLLPALVGHATSATNAIVRGPILAISAQIIWNVQNVALAGDLLTAYGSDDSAMVVVGMSPIACFGPTDRYRAMLAALCGDARVEDFLAAASDAAQRVRAPRWRARLLHDGAAIRSSLGSEAEAEADAVVLRARADVASGFAKKGHGHRRVPDRVIDRPS